MNLQKPKKFESIDEYAASLPPALRKILKKIRAEIAKRVPTATEKISYNLPAFKGRINFIYFGVFKDHVGVYPPVKNKTLLKKLKPYLQEKGNLAFPLDEDIPYDLIGEIAVALSKQYS